MCFSLGWLEQLCVYIVVIMAIWAIIKLLIPMIGVPLIAQILNIVLWAIVAIMCIYIIFGFIGCLTGGGFSLVPHR
jgi:hypothetical protein